MRREASNSKSSDITKIMIQTLTHSAETQDMRLNDIGKRIHDFSMQNGQILNNIREMINAQLSAIQSDNEKKLESIRLTVEEKMQKTLEERIGRSFQLVTERLDQVYKGLGEMQALATGVGDLKKVLSGVKTRGILGEIQLGAILEQILSPEQYGVNVQVNPHAQNFVEFAVKLPGDGNSAVWLPIDSKFPADHYSALRDAYDTADKELIEAAVKKLKDALRKSAKDIHDKYIAPPYTTDFALMFLPFEGLYAETVQLGLVEVLQNEYKVNIAGPTTTAALLNSLQMGFRTLSIQKRSSEVWKVLGEVKNEFVKFGDVLASAQKKLDSASKELDNLSGTRTNQIMRKLRDVETLPGETVEGKELL